MPNSKLPIQRANRTCDSSASKALPTRTRKTFPATNWASRLSWRSASTDLMRAKTRASADGGAGFTFSGAKDGKAIASA
jgi:hypothetical protein